MHLDCIDHVVNFMQQFRSITNFQLIFSFNHALIKELVNP